MITSKIYVMVTTYCLVYEWNIFWE